MGIPERYRLDVSPMREWLTRRAYELELNTNAVSVDAIGAGLHLTPHQRLLRLLGWDDTNDAGARRLYRWMNEADVIDRRDVEDALDNADVDLFDVYPQLAPPAGRKDRGRSYVCTDEILVAAHTMHMEGLSIRQVARELFDDCYSATPKALANAFISAFRGRDWDIRSRSEATSLSNVQRAFRPFCSHVHQLGERKGETCSRRCVGNDQWCWKHNPDRIAEGIARIRQERAA